jgi:hypothetical protein
MTIEACALCGEVHPGAPPCKGRKYLIPDPKNPEREVPVTIAVKGFEVPGFAEALSAAIDRTALAQQGRMTPVQEYAAAIDGYRTSMRWGSEPADERTHRLTELVAKWRARAAENRAPALDCLSEHAETAFASCANELEALLRS